MGGHSESHHDSHQTVSNATDSDAHHHHADAHGHGGHHGHKTLADYKVDVTPMDRKLWGYYNEGRMDMCTDYFIAFTRCMRDLTKGKGLFRSAVLMHFATDFQCHDEATALHLCELERYKNEMKRHKLEIDGLNS